MGACPTGDVSILNTLRFECEKAKIRLSEEGVYKTRIEVPLIQKGSPGFGEIYEDYTFVFDPIIRADFEDWCYDIFQRLKAPLDEALEVAAVTPEEIDVIVVVGGSSRIPYVKSWLRKYFNIPEPLTKKQM